MSIAENDGYGALPDDKPMSRDWHYHPELPIRNAALFDWPPSVTGIAKWFAGVWLTVNTVTIWLALAIAVYYVLIPDLERMKTLEFSWIAEFYIRNLALIFTVAGGLHLYFYTFRRQGDRRRYDARAATGNRKKFTFNNQVHDNMFWTLASGVTFWTAYEVLYFWGLANGMFPWVDWVDNPVWFVAWFVLIPLWSSMHFYWIHRFIHLKPIYKLAHALHHRNVNIGPWTGISMHPLEHLLYFSSVAIHFVVPSHPVHFLLHMYFESLNPCCSHSGYRGILAGNRIPVELGDFHHQLHHRYFECNYGTASMPWDKWFGTFHDGSEEETRRTKERMKKVHGRKS